MKTWLGLSVAAITFFCTVSFANDIPLPDAQYIIDQVNSRDDGAQYTRTLRLTLTDKSGKTLERETFGYRKNYDGERRSVVYTISPASYRNFALLTYDYAEAGRDDDQWAYLPDMRKIRRIPPSYRGTYVLGTDFTFEDIKNESKIPTADYTYTALGQETLDGRICYILEGLPIDEGTAKVLGYGKIRLWVDSEIWFPRKFASWDVSGDPLKSVTMNDVRQVDGIWTSFHLEAENLQTGHRSQVTTIDVDYTTPLDDGLFTERALRRGVNRH